MTALRRYALAICLALIATPASASELRPVVTGHQVQIAGRTLRYTAEIGRLAIRDAGTGEPRGWIGYTAYRVARRPSASPRPVTFVWNGGPGAPSTLLHFNVAGPLRIEGERLVDNADSWLPSTDLVFVDPVGTGFSRPEKAEYAADFYGTVGDTMSVAEFVRSWRLTRGLEDAPLYLAGESWGASRAATVAYQLLKRRVPVAGMLLISGGWALNSTSADPAAIEAASVGDMAAVALHHGRIAPDLAHDVAASRRAADVWAQQAYAPALTRIASLSDAERDAIAASLARFTGIPAQAIDRRTLVITARQFRTTLLGDEGKPLYVFDLRATREPEASGDAAILRYFRQGLGYATDLPYLGIERLGDGFAPSGKVPPGAAKSWNYATTRLSDVEVQAAIAAAIASGSGPPKLGPPLPATEEAIALSPSLRVLVVGGLYDSFRPCGAGRVIADALPPGLARAIRFICYPAGHAMYLDAPVRVALSRDVRNFIEKHAR